MAKTICCRDVGLDCDFRATGETVEDVMAQAAVHAREAHGLEKIPPELVPMVKAAIQDA